ncbi:MAG: hypothetical protein ACOYIF_00835 [Acetivibrionales bacterium]|jgi:hypothetical protein
MVSEITTSRWIGVLSVFNLLFALAFVAASIYAFILFIKLARLGIEALRIYIEKNK